MSSTEPGTLAQLGVGEGVVVVVVPVLVEVVVVADVDEELEVVVGPFTQKATVDSISSC
jgi:hypothetical protein